jgi:hypothetical protein
MHACARACARANEGREPSRRTRRTQLLSRGVGGRRVRVRARAIGAKRERADGLPLRGQQLHICISRELVAPLAPRPGLAFES